MSGTPPGKGTRFLALLIDSILVMVVTWIPFIGPVLGAAYFLVRDGLSLDFMNQRSIGKHLMGLKVKRADGRAMDIETSVRRNWMFAIGGVTALLAEIPFLGWLLALPLSFAALIIVLYEAYRVLTRSDQQRWGDSMAATSVVRA
ncbi:MAG: RDD family protein [Longimonas sp.]|uniref:RDD family protein n=1 Tax=Longimonas sp. TaxID=2039626 RepID=UPI00335A95EB